jgi:hypothetical protein
MARSGDFNRVFEASRTTLPILADHSRKGRVMAASLSQTPCGKSQVKIRMYSLYASLFVARLDMLANGRSSLGRGK